VTSDRRLSPSFRLSEFLRSDTATRAGRAVEPTMYIERELERLCVLVLEPIRAELGRPIRILSGYRPEWLNELIGGAPKSNHVEGRAADIEVEGMSDFEACERIAQLVPSLPVGQLIQEFPPTGWVHVSVCEFGTVPPREILTARKIDRRTVYQFGLWRPIQ
jgi:zinc D-Ala-D-Ala carboxypeptidase